MFGITSDILHAKSKKSANLISQFDINMMKSRSTHSYVVDNINDDVLKRDYTQIILHDDPNIREYSVFAFFDSIITYVLTYTLSNYSDLPLIELYESNKNPSDIINQVHKFQLFRDRSIFIKKRNKRTIVNNLDEINPLIHAIIASGNLENIDPVLFNLLVVVANNDYISSIPQLQLLQIVTDMISF